MARSKKRTKTADRNTMVWLGAVVVAAAMVAAVAVVGVSHLWKGIARMDEFKVTVAHTLPSSPWLRPEPAREDFFRTDPTGVLSRKVSLFTPGLTDEVARAYAANPWVRRVREVRKVFPNRLAVRMDVREPYALAVLGDKRCCLDHDGVVLSPAIYQLTPDRLADLGPEIALPAGLPSPQVGAPWNEGAVQSGLAMMRVCREQFSDIDVRCIEIVPSVDSMGRQFAMVTLVLADGPRVEWGRAPLGPASPAEVSTPQKAANLRAIVANEGDSLSRLRTINVRYHPTLIQTGR